MSEDRCITWERSFRWQPGKEWFTTPAEDVYTVTLQSPGDRPWASKGSWRFLIEQYRSGASGETQLKPVLANGRCPLSANPQRSCARLLSRLLMGKIPSSRVVVDAIRQDFPNAPPASGGKIYLDLRGRIPAGWSRSKYPPVPDGPWECVEYEDE